MSQETALALGSTAHASSASLSAPRPGRVRLERAVGIMRARFLLRGCELGARVYAGSALQVVRRGHICIGEGVSFIGGMLPTRLVAHPGARLEVGARTVLNYGVSLEAHGRVHIGQRCMLGSFVRLCDRGLDGRGGALVIGDDVWLAHGVIVEAGVTIGEGAVVAAGSVVVHDVPPHSLALGNPARAMSLALFAPEPDGRGDAAVPEGHLHDSGG